MTAKLPPPVKNPAYVFARCGSCAHWLASIKQTLALVTPPGAQAPQWVTPAQALTAGLLTDQTPHAEWAPCTLNPNWTDRAEEHYCGQHRLSQIEGTSDDMGQGAPLAHLGRANPRRRAN